jgi:hypothetical protein
MHGSLLESASPVHSIGKHDKGPPTKTPRHLLSLDRFHGGEAAYQEGNLPCQSAECSMLIYWNFNYE